MSKIATAVSAALLAGACLGFGPAQAQQSPPLRAQQPGVRGAATDGRASVALGACRVKDQAGGRSCTGDVPEATCAVIAREAKGTSTWTPDPCP
jgi:hypothetical protein